MHTQTANLKVAQTGNNTLKVSSQQKARTLDVPIVKAPPKGITNREEFKKPSQNYARSNAAAREMMKRYINGRNRDSSLSSYEKQKFDMRKNMNLAVPVLRQGRDSRQGGAERTSSKSYHRAEFSLDMSKLAELNLDEESQNIKAHTHTLMDADFTVE